MTRPSRISRARILEQLRLAARKGDRAALILAADQMKTLAFSPRYWKSYLELLRSPLARLVDLLLIKQGERIARQKGGWPRPRRTPSPRASPPRKRAPRPRRAAPREPQQPSLFPDIPA